MGRKKSRYHTIPIEVPVHVARYFDSHLNGEIKVSRRSKFGNMILRTLTVMPYGKSPRLKKQGKHYVDILVNKTYVERRHYLPDEYIPEVQSLLRQLFYDQFHSEVDHLRIYWGKRMTEAVAIFLEKYNISEDDYPFNTAYINYQRYKERSREVEIQPSK